MNSWWIYRGTGEPHDGIDGLPEPPSWRKFTYRKENELRQPVKPDLATHIIRRLGEGARGAKFQASDEEKDLINAALYLRRPLLVTGKPGSGKSSLAYAVAYELKLGPVLRWPITTRTTLQDGLYHYDAIARLQDASLLSRDHSKALPDIGQYIRLGPLGTALLPYQRPRVLLIDEIDKSDIDLPNDLLNVFEEGEFYIPELARMSTNSGVVKVMPYDSVNDEDRVPIEGGQLRCHAFPFVILTSNGERDFPPAFLRRCLRLDMQPPDKEKLTNIIEAHLGPEVLSQAEQLITNFIERRTMGDLATDQLLNAIYLATHNGIGLSDKDKLLNALLMYLTDIEVS